MSHMDYNWKDIVQCSVMWPTLEVLAVVNSLYNLFFYILLQYTIIFLQVPNNKMTCLEWMNNDMFNYLRVLNLEGNNIEYWEEVNKLGQLPK